MCVSLCVCLSLYVYVSQCVCVKRRQTEDMSEHEWDVCVFLLSLSSSLFLWMCACVCVSGTARVERLSFLRTDLIENRDFERREKEQQKQLRGGMKTDQHLHVLRGRSMREDKCLWRCMCVSFVFPPLMDAHLCVYSWLYKLWFTAAERLWSLLRSILNNGC